MKQNFGEFHDLHIRPNSEQSKKEAPQEHVLTKLETEHEQTARDIARQGDFENILRTLEKKDLLEEQILRLQEKYFAQLESADFLTNEDWEALTVLELYDTGTFLHSLETYRIAKDKIETKFVFEGIEIEFDKRIREEGLVSLQQFYRACLLHDIGKVEVPYCIIASEITHNEWAEMLVQADRRNPEQKLLETALEQAGISIPQDVSQKPEGEIRDAYLLELLKKNKVRCEKYVPIEEAVGNPILGGHAFSEKNMADLESRNIPGISRKSPLFDVAKIHEKNSFDILSRVMKLEKEAALAGAHHDYDGSHARMIEKYLYTVSSFHISAMLAEFLSLPDMFQAITSKRTYKSAETQLEALNDLADAVNAKNNPNLFFVAYVWIGSDLKLLNLPSDHEQVETLKNKIEGFSRKIGGISA